MVSVDQRQMGHLLETELRHIEASKLNPLSAIIDTSKDWKILIEKLSDPQNTSSRALNLSPANVNLIEQQTACGKSPTLALLNHWSITGRRRPTIRTLLHYLSVCNLKQAEFFVLRHILGLKIEENAPNVKKIPLELNGGLKQFDIDDIYYFKDTTDIVSGLDSLKCPKFCFKTIYQSTNGFCHKPYDLKNCSGSKIGEGRFSSVFRAEAIRVDDSGRGLENTARVVAAKLLKSECSTKNLVNEIDLTVKIDHENIMKILGVSLGSDESGSERPQYVCLVYEFMENGSLLDCLSAGLVVRGDSAATSERNKYLTWRERVSMGVKIARAIAYLHTFHESPIIHRDVKSANIFISARAELKLGDFTLVRQLASTETQYSQNIIGTSVYMPPEAFRGDISIKFDTFSFGIVLLELLTGLRPFQEGTSEDLFTHITGRLSDIEDEFEELALGESAVSLDDLRDRFLREILDARAGDEWAGAQFGSAKALFSVALQATETRKKDRPEMTSLLPKLDAIQL